MRRVAMAMPSPAPTYPPLNIVQTTDLKVQYTFSTASLSAPNLSFGFGTTQVRVRKVEGLDELSWGELEGQDFKLEPFKGRLASLKQAWDEGTFDR